MMKGTPDPTMEGSRLAMIGHERDSDTMDGVKVLEKECCKVKSRVLRRRWSGLWLTFSRFPKEWTSSTS